MKSKRRQELKINDKTKIICQVVDSVHAGQEHVDIRVTRLEPIQHRVWKKDDDGKPLKDKKGRQIFTTKIVDTWCRNSQGLEVPLNRWAIFQAAIATIDPAVKP